jgi:hypothetical protein
MAFWNSVTDKGQKCLYYSLIKPEKPLEVGLLLIRMPDQN